MPQLAPNNLMLNVASSVAAQKGLSDSIIYLGGGQHSRAFQVGDQVIKLASPKHYDDPIKNDAERNKVLGSYSREKKICNLAHSTTN